MRIDVSAHLGHWPFRPLPDATPGSLLDRMDALGIDAALVSNLHGLFYAHPRAANDEVLAWRRSAGPAGDRLWPMAVVNPSYPGWTDEFDRCLAEGFLGFRLYPQYHDYGLASADLAALLRRAEERNVPVAFSLRMIDARGRSWLDSRVVEAETEQLRLEAVARAIAPFPALRCMVLQAIFEQLTPEAVETLKRAHVLFDTTRATTCGVAGPNSYDLAREQARFGAQRFAFGTMTPFTDRWSPVLRVEAGEFGAREREALMAGHARAFLERNERARP